MVNLGSGIEINTLTFTPLVNAYFKKPLER